MTDEQIELEYAHLQYDKKLKEGRIEYEDSEYDNWEKDTEDGDSQLYIPDMADDMASEVQHTPEHSESYDPNEWEDVEIDD